jgi:hypothetical protein
MAKNTENDRPTAEERARALVRLLLGQAQLLGALVSFYLLLTNGTNSRTLGGVVFTCLPTSVSLVLFRRRGQE